MEIEGKELIARLFQNVTLPDACFEWQGGTTDFGHGRIKVAGKLESPHRIVYEIFIGPLQDGEMVLHHCDNPPCVNPRHLFKGSGADNMKDCAAKGRLGVQRDPSFTQGENRPTAKLNDPAVREIRKLAAEGLPKKVLARQFGVHRSIIQKILKRQRWAHVQD